MKNEDRIVELLAESLKIQDRHSELLTHQGEILTRQGEILIRHGELLEKIIERQDRAEQQQREASERIIASVDALTDIVKIWMERTKKLDDHEERIRKLERKAG